MRKLLSTAAAIGIFVSTSVSPVVFAEIDANALPRFKNGTNVTVEPLGTNNDKLNIKITGGESSVGTANWHSFNIGKDATVNVEFTAKYQTSLNRVDAAGGVSQIYGNFTNSGCYGCGNFADTGKVILLNPNGIAFGKGANVNLNSFTASTMNGTYDEASKKLILTRDPNNDKNPSIQVANGAKIYGDKGVGFASDNIYAYKGSQIATNTVLKNADTDGDGIADATLGKVKLITADGVNFEYYNNQSFKAVEQVKATPDKMIIFAAGDVISGHIDVRNASTHDDSTLNANEAILKAYKAERGNDGNIWLTSNSKVAVAHSDIITENVPGEAGAKTREGGNIVITGVEKVALEADILEAVGDIIINSPEGDIGVSASDLTAKAEKVEIVADGVASVQTDTLINADKVIIKGGERAQVVLSEINADDVEITGGDVWFAEADIDADNIDVNADNDIFTNNGETNFHNSKTNLNAGGDIDIDLSNTNGGVTNITANANDVININSKGKLAVEDLKANRQIIIVSDDIAFNNGDLEALDYIRVTATSGDITTTGDPAKLKSGSVVLRSDKGNITGSYDLAQSPMNMTAKNNIDVTLSGADSTAAGLVATAGGSLTVVDTVDDVLAISRLVAKNGDLTITAKDVVIGNPQNNFNNNDGSNEERFDKNSSDPDTRPRGFLYVKNGNFISNVGIGDYGYDKSGGEIYKDAEGNEHPTRHYIHYNNDNQKRFYLIHIPATAANGGNGRIAYSTLTSLQDSQASKQIKNPPRPELFNANTNILDQRTAFVDVFAAASQIEIEDEDY